jgi:hypothetical protein
VTVPLQKLNHWVLLFLFGSLWGLMEVLAGGAFFKKAVPHATVVLSAWALLMMAVARVIWNRPGTSTLVGAFAALFKLANAAPFYCHLVGIVMLGVAFDLAATFLVRKVKPLSLRSSLVGLTSPLVANTLFGIFMAFIIRYKYWATGGWPKVLDYIFVTGGLTALAGLVLVPLGFWLGANAESLSVRKPRLALAGAMTGLIAVWTLARVLG